MNYGIKNGKIIKAEVGRITYQRADGEEFNIGLFMPNDFNPDGLVGQYVQYSLNTGPDNWGLRQWVTKEPVE
ncbi:MAG: hypothetical protein H7325_02180 [Pedobacter sp.]|nr:hypothetical protein [Pedobacter sp.]